MIHSFVTSQPLLNMCHYCGHKRVKFPESEETDREHSTTWKVLTYRKKSYDKHTPTPSGKINRRCDDLKMNNSKSQEYLRCYTVKFNRDLLHIGRRFAVPKKNEESKGNERTRDESNNHVSQSISLGNGCLSTCLVELFFQFSERLTTFNRNIWKNLKCLSITI